jgi:hypothetical protein
MAMETEKRPSRRHAARGRAYLAGWIIVLLPVLVSAAGCGPSEVGSVKRPEGVSRGSFHDKGPAAWGFQPAPGRAEPSPGKVP